MGWLARKSRIELRVQRVIPLRFAPVEIQVMGEGSLDVLRARNVSATGLGVYVPHGFEGFDLSAVVELVVTLPGETPFLARGKIKHVTESEGEARHFGLQFSEIDKQHRRLLERYVKSRRE